MKILLIKPKLDYPIRNNDIGIPMGLWVLKDLVSHIAEIDIFDERLDCVINGKDSVWEKILKYDIIGVSTCTSEFPRALSLLRYAKSYNKTTIIGGIFVYSNELYLSKFSFIDYIIPGVATTPFFNLINALSNNAYSYKIEGVFGCRKFSSNKSEYPEMLYSVSNESINKIFELYNVPLNGKFFLTTSRGCYNKCEFCSIQRELKSRVLYKNVDTVLNEVIQLIRLGVSKISLKDELFISNLNKDRNIELLYKIQQYCCREDKRVILKIKSRIDYMINNIDLIEQLSRLNVREIQFGIESIDNSILQGIKKGRLMINIDKVKDVIQRCYDHNIIVNASFVFCLIGENEQYYSQFENFINDIYCNNGLLKIYLNFYTPHPFNNKIHLADNYILCNKYLESYTHVIPCCYPNYFDKRCKEILIETYNNIVSRTNSEKYNPQINQKFIDLFLSENAFDRELPDFNS